MLGKISSESNGKDKLRPITWRKMRVESVQKYWFQAKAYDNKNEENRSIIGQATQQGNNITQSGQKSRNPRFKRSEMLIIPISTVLDTDKRLENILEAPGNDIKKGKKRRIIWLKSTLPVNASRINLSFQFYGQKSPITVPLNPQSPEFPDDELFLLKGRGNSYTLCIAKQIRPMLQTIRRNPRLNKLFQLQFLHYRKMVLKPRQCCKALNYSLIIPETTLNNLNVLQVDDKTSINLPKFEDGTRLRVMLHQRIAPYVDKQQRGKYRTFFVSCVRAEKGRNHTLEFKDHEKFISKVSVPETKKSKYCFDQIMKSKLWENKLRETAQQLAAAKYNKNEI